MLKILCIDGVADAMSSVSMLTSLERLELRNECTGHHNFGSLKDLVQSPSIAHASPIRMPLLLQFTIDNCDLDSQGSLEVVAEWLQGAPHLQHLALSNCRIDSGDVAALVEGLGRFTGLRSLNMSGNRALGLSVACGDHGRRSFVRLVHTCARISTLVRTMLCHD